VSLFVCLFLLFLFLLMVVFFFNLVDIVAIMMLHSFKVFLLNAVESNKLFVFLV
jgi:hypothetical protein